MMAELNWEVLIREFSFKVEGWTISLCVYIILRVCPQYLAILLYEHICRKWLQIPHHIYLLPLVLIKLLPDGS